MSYPFTLPTTSHLTFQADFTSSTHPSLPAAATSRRSVVRSELKSHKRLKGVDQSNNYSNLISVFNNYLKLLWTLDQALSNRPVAGEHIDIALIREVEVQWRPTLSSSPVPGREVERVKGQGLDYELYFTIHTLAIVHSLTARQTLLSLYSSSTPTAEHRTSQIQSSIKSLQQAYSLHTYLVHRSNTSPEGPPPFPPSAIDISTPVQLALQHLSHAQMNLLSILKDDPYPAILIQSRNKDDKEWMIKPPSIPKVRAQVLTRLCIGAGEHASSALASLQSNPSQRVSKSLLSFTSDLRSTSRAKACRFQCLSHDDSGQTGIAIAWLHAGLHELGLPIPSATSSSSGLSLSRMKQSLTDRREDKKLSNIATSAKASAEWGLDAGKAEEGRIIGYLVEKMNKMNDSFNVQVVPEWRTVVGQLPGGMNMPVPTGEVVKTVGEEELVGMRAPLEYDADRGAGAGVESSEDEEGGVGGGGRGIPGAFEAGGGSGQGRAYY